MLSGANGAAYFGEKIMSDMPKEDPRYENRNAEIEAALKDIGSRIGSQLPKGWGFNLAISSFGEHGSTFYLSNMDREGAIGMLRELIAKMEKEGRP